MGRGEMAIWELRTEPGLVMAATERLTPAGVPLLLTAMLLY